MTDRLFTTKDIIETFGIPMPRLRMWLLNEFILPSVPSEGQGKKASFTRSDFYAIAVFLKLLEKGLKREEAAKHVKILQDSMIDLKCSNYIVFLTKKSNNHVITESLKVSGIDPLGLMMWPGKISMMDYESMTETELGEFMWEDVLIINFGLIKAVIDSKLK